MKKTLVMIFVVFAMSMMGNVVNAHDDPVDRDGCHLDPDGRKHCH
jgi:hypothetical protein